MSSFENLVRDVTDFAKIRAKDMGLLKSDGEISLRLRLHHPKVSRLGQTESNWKILRKNPTLIESV